MSWFQIAINTEKHTLIRYSIVAQCYNGIHRVLYLLRHKETPGILTQIQSHLMFLSHKTLVNYLYATCLLQSS